MFRGKIFFRGLAKKSEGAAAVEFAIVLNLLLLLIMGMIDFGHAYFMKQIIINASREGARYGVVYQNYVGTNNRKPPAAYTPSIQNWVLQPPPAGEYGLINLLPADANATVTVAGAGYVSGQVGADLSVTVTCQKRWIVLDRIMKLFGSSLNNTITLTAVTVMRVE
jgi:Flp pilus assembly protein TadG